MANRFFGLNRGQDRNNPVTEGSSTGATDIEIRVDDTKNLTKKDVQILIDQLNDHILFVNTTIP